MAQVGMALDEPGEAVGVPRSPGWALRQERARNERCSRRLCTFWSSRVVAAALCTTVMVTIVSPLRPETAQTRSLPGSQVAAFKGAGPFGLSVAIARTTVFAGSTNKVNIFAETPSRWGPDGTLEGSDAVAHSGFGAALSASWPTLLVGAAEQPGGGRVYVFTDKDGKWKQSSVLVAPRDSRGFGSSVAISGSTAVVSSEAASSAGRVFIFHEDSSGRWERLGELTVPGSLPGFDFGITLAISNTSIVVGSGNASGYNVYFFEEEERGWREVSNWRFPGIISDESSVAISGEYALVGLGSFGQEFGRVFVFSYTRGSWIQVEPLAEPYARGLEELGTSVAMSGNRAIVGAACYEECAGVAYDFTRTDEGWSQVASLSASDLVAGDYFGVSAAMSGDTAVVGAFPGRELYLFRI
ncbi:MAG: FG-GAP repeat protein [Acidimicrobiales bacterium]